MKTTNRFAFAALAILLLIFLPSPVNAAAPAPQYTTTYTITVTEDGTAIWQVEYRTALESDADVTGFEAYTRDLTSVYLPQVQDIMQRSAAQASVAASRPMAISNLSGNAVVQLSPTGKYGVVVYSFTWDGFAERGSDLVIGDAFAGGLYLAKDTTLIIRYPEGYAVRSSEPSPDQHRDTLIWYGQQSFTAGEPRIILEKSIFPFIPAVMGIIIIILALAGFMFYRARKPRVDTYETGEPPLILTDDEQKNVDERIVQFLLANGGEQFQSDIVRLLGLPRSTVSASLNNLHKKGIVLKVKKGRENLIRLVKPEK